MKGYKKQRGSDSKSWTLVYDAPRKEDGKRNQKWVKFYGTSKQADAELARLIHEAESGQYSDPSKVTVRELLQQYLDGNEARWESKTHLGYEEKIRNYISPALGGVLVEKLTASKIDRFLGELQKTGGRYGEGISPQTAHHCRAILRAAINWAVRKGVIRLRLNPVTHSDPVRIPHEDMQILAPDEVALLVRACEGSIWEVPIVLALYTGMRQGECLGLHWSEVDLGGGTIRVRRSLEYVRGKLSLKEPKNSYSKRTFEVTPEVIGLLEKHREAQKLRRIDLGELYSDRGMVCAMEDGDYMRNWSVSKGLQEILSNAKLRQVRFHDLRHTHISISLANGESIIRVAQRVGHADAGMILKRYAHCIPGDLGAPVHFAQAIEFANKQKEEN